MARLKLTKKSVDALRKVDKPSYFYDTDLAGFFIRVMPSGSKAWGIEYRSGHGRSAPKRRYSMGSSSFLTPEEARTRAKQLLASVAMGKDPAHERSNTLNSSTVRTLIDLWKDETLISKRTGRPITARVKANTYGRLQAHVVPILGTKKIDQVSPKDIANLIAAVTAGKTNCLKPSGKKRGRIRITGGRGAARKVVSDLSIVMNFAIERGLAASNPVKVVARPMEGKRNEYLRPSEISRLGEAFSQLEAEGVNQSGITVNRLILLTGCRPSEIEGLRWIEVDFEGQCLRLEETKVGFSVRPLSDAALEIFRGIEKGTSPFVFPSTVGNGHYKSSVRVWNRAREIADLPERVRYHARHAVATLALSSGADITSVAAIMGHRSPRTTLSTYAHVVDKKAQEAAQNLGTLLSEALDASASSK